MLSFGHHAVGLEELGLVGGDATHEGAPEITVIERLRLARPAGMIAIGSRLMPTFLAEAICDLFEPHQPLE
jgi:hypothetical protein